MLTLKDQQEVKFKFENFYLSKDPMKKAKIQATNWKMIVYLKQIINRK